MSTANSEFNVAIPSFDELITLYADEKKLEEAKRKTLKIKKEAKISGLMKQAQVRKIEAEAALADALLGENADEAAAVKSVIDATRTYEFYSNIYEALFPNA